jgi:superfamily II DNA/RNA helicase
MQKPYMNKTILTTPIQEQSIPLDSTSGRLIVVHKPEHGKTAAFAT